MNRVLRRFIGLLSLAAIAFAQIATAAYACRFVPGAPEAVESISSMPCERDTEAPALCIKHCQDEPQKSTDTCGSGPSQAFVPLYWFTLAVEPSARRLPVMSPELLHAPPPALSIRNCCFRI